MLSATKGSSFRSCSPACTPRILLRAMTRAMPCEPRWRTLWDVRPEGFPVLARSERSLRPFDGAYSPVFSSTRIPTNTTATVPSGGCIMRNSNRLSRRITVTRGLTRNANSRRRRGLASTCESATQDSLPIRIGQAMCIPSAWMRSRMCKGLETESQSRRVAKVTPGPGRAYRPSPPPPVRPGRPFCAFGGHGAACLPPTVLNEE